MKQHYISQTRQAYRFGWNWAVQKVYSNGAVKTERFGWAPTKKWGEGAARRRANILQKIDDAEAAPWSEVAQ